MSDRIYCYPEWDILINKLNIHDLNKLNEAERKLTQLRINDLITSPVCGNYYLKHLQKIHRYIFQDLYEWAGKIRTVDIAKSNMFIKKIAYYFSEINALHPFRDGHVIIRTKLEKPSKIKGLHYFSPYFFMPAGKHY